MTQLKYGCEKGSKVADPVPMAASQVIADQEGHFVFMNDGAATLCIDTSTTIFGWVEAHAHTPTVGDYLNCIHDINAVFKIPVGAGTFVVGMIGDTCDIDSSHKAALDTSSHDLLLIVGGDLVNNEYVLVKINPAEQGTGAGADA